jgi:hypothetical protein
MGFVSTAWPAFELHIINCNGAGVLRTKAATEPRFLPVGVQRYQAVQEIKAAVAESFRIPQASRVAQRSALFGFGPADSAFEAPLLRRGPLQPSQVSKRNHSPLSERRETVKSNPRQTLRR